MLWKSVFLYGGWICLYVYNVKVCIFFYLYILIWLVIDCEFVKIWFNVILVDLWKIYI